MFNTKDKNVLFISTKNKDYLRNVQEMRILSENSKSLTVLSYSDKSYIKRLIKIYFKLLFMRVKKFDTVFIGFAPQLILPLLSFKFRKVDIIIDFFISVYDTLVFDRKKFKENSIPAKLCKWIDKKCIHKADYVICDTNAHRDYFSEEFEVDRNKINTLYLEADTSIYTSKNLNKPEELKDKFVVLYFGSVLPLQGTDVIIDAMNSLSKEKDLYFYFIGPLKDEKQIKSENICHINWLSQEDLAKHIDYSDLCLAGHFNKDINKAKRTIPGKAYIYEAMKKPMILGDNNATHELYSEDDNHYFVEMGSSKALAEKILEIKEHR